MYGSTARIGVVPEGTNPAGKIDKFAEHRRERFLGRPAASAARLSCRNAGKAQKNSRWFGKPPVRTAV